jgi:hypothetical protein
VTAALTLDLAEALLRTPLPVMRGRWPRVVALLTRQSLEEAIDELWAARLPAMAATSARAQLLCLPEYLGDDEVAEDAAHTWGWLSNVCHHRSYEVAPTSTELQGAVRSVRRLVEAVARAGSPAY